MPVQKLLNRNNYIICYCMPVQKLLIIIEFVIACLCKSCLIIIICYCMPVQKLLNRNSNMSLVKFVAATEVT